MQNMATHVRSGRDVFWLSSPHSNEMRGQGITTPSCAAVTTSPAPSGAWGTTPRLRHSDVFPIRASPAPTTSQTLPKGLRGGHLHRRALPKGLRRRQT